MSYHCFNAGGQDAFPDDVLLKVPVTSSYSSNLEAFANKLLWAFENREEAKKIGNKAKEYVYKHLTWENKVEEFNTIYQEILNNTSK